MHIEVFESREEMGAAAAACGAAHIREAIAERGTAHIVLATGNSQFELLAPPSQSRTDCLATRDALSSG